MWGKKKDTGKNVKEDDWLSGFWYLASTTDKQTTIKREKEKKKKGEIVERRRTRHYRSVDLGTSENDLKTK